MLNKTANPRPPPIPNLKFSRVPKYNHLQSSYGQNSNSARPGNKRNNGFSKSCPMSARVQPPKPLLRKSANPRFHFLIPRPPESPPIRLNNTITNAPITADEALELFGTMLSPFELTEIDRYPEISYLGNNSRKHIMNISDSRNFGFDDDDGNYKIEIGDHLAYRFEMITILGSGKHSKVVKCFDHQWKEYVAIKILSSKQTRQQRATEMKILAQLNQNGSKTICHTQSYFIFRDHICLIFDVMNKSVFQLMSLNHMNTLSPRLVRAMTQDVIHAMADYKKLGVLHGCINSTNIVLVPNTNAEFKLIDFSNAYFEDNKPEGYQLEIEEHYRPPEMILGHQYNSTIDMWCLGVLITHILIGHPVFNGKDELEQLSMMTEIMGNPSPELIEASRKRDDFFDDENQLLVEIENPLYKIREPASLSIRTALSTTDAQLCDFLMKIFVWEPENRLKIEDALEHPYITTTDSRLPEISK